MDLQHQPVFGGQLCHQVQEVPGEPGRVDLIGGTGQCPTDDRVGVCVAEQGGVDGQMAMVGRQSTGGNEFEFACGAVLPAAHPSR